MMKLWMKNNCRSENSQARVNMGEEIVAMKSRESSVARTCSWNRLRFLFGMRFLESSLLV